jgi:hypothetical protein
VIGVAVHAPLARAPENAMKFVVGVMLTSFGMFWGVEGAGGSWPGSDAALLAIIPAVLALGLGLVWTLRRQLADQAGGPSASGAAGDAAVGDATDGRASAEPTAAPV